MAYDKRHTGRVEALMMTGWRDVQLVTADPQEQEAAEEEVDRMVAAEAGKGWLSLRRCVQCF